ncbi:unnamed protein product, partial [Mesorhabditis belari]|uniref:carnosine N-methyltransferase n=1 Tax=Mesorhabditis belari TaxID=2138241 RepID=A0AAF3EN81_9BILA
MNPSTSNDDDLNEEHKPTDADSMHTAKIMKAMLSYRSFGREKLCEVISSFRSLSNEHIQLVAAQHTKHIRSCFDCVDENQKFLEMVVAFSANMFGGEDQAIQLLNELAPATNHFMDKVKSTLRQVIREWSSTGAQEREATYRPIIEELERRFPTDRENIQILVPGAGLGRLAWEFVERGFSVQANEYSMFMLLTSCFFLNKPLELNSLTIYPHTLETSNLWSYEDALQPIKFPDISPGMSDECRKNTFSMCAGDFLEVTKEDTEQFDCVVTAWFIDTANNIISYIERIREILKPGGVWINVGPLTYHYSEMEGEVSIELPYAEVLRIVREKGFIVENERGLESSYSANYKSMLRYLYTCAFFAASKPKMPSEMKSPKDEASDATQQAGTSESSEDGALVVPVSRIKMIYDTVPDVLPLSADGAAALSMAVECLAQDLLEKVYKRAKNDEIDYDDVSAMIRSEDELSWLHEFVPKRLTYEKACSIIQNKENAD